MSNTSNFWGNTNGALGPAVVVVDPIVQTGDSGSAINLGDTQGVTVRFTQEKSDLTSDQDGTQPFNRVVTGELCEVECNLVKTSHTILEAVMQGYTANASGAEGGQQASAIGEADLDIALPLGLTLFKDGAASSDPDDELLFPLAAPMGEWEVAYDAGTQRVINVKFRCYKDPQYVDSAGKPLFFFTREAVNNGHVIFVT